MEPTKRLKIVVVEDHKDSRDVLCELLTAEGHEVISAASGDLVLTAASGPPPDLVFLDFVTPGMSAATFVRELKNKPGYADVPIVLLTGMEEPHVPGVVGFIRKPLPFDRLAEIISRYVRS